MAEDLTVPGKPESAPAASETPAPAPAPVESAAPAVAPVQVTPPSTMPKLPTAAQNPYPTTALDDPTQSTVSKVAVAASQPTTPDQAARNLTLSMKTGVPTEYIQQDPDGFENAMNQSNFSPEQFVQSNPKLASWVAQNTQHYPLIKNDMPNIQDTTNKIGEYGMLKSAYDALGAGMGQLAASTARIPGLIYDMAALPQNILAATVPGFAGLQARAADLPIDNKVAEYYENQAKVFSDRNSDLNDSVGDEISKGNFARAGRVAFAKMVQGAPQIAQLFVGGAQAHAAKLMLLAAQQGAETANRPENKEADPVASTIDAMTQGSIAAGAGEVGNFSVLEKWGQTLTQTYGKQAATTVIKSFANALTYAFARDASSQTAMSAANDLSDYMTGINPNALQGIAGRALESGVIGGLTGAVIASPAAVLSMHSSVHDIRQAQLQKDFYTSLGDSVQASETRAKLPPKYQEMVGAFTKDGPVENVYIDPNAMEQHYQSKGPDELPKVISDLGVQKNFDQAKDSGGLVKIPLGDWVTKIDPEAYKALADDVTFDPAQPTKNEAKAANDIAQANEERVRSEGGNFDDLGRGVIEQVRDKLIATGMDPKTAETNASFYNFFNVMAQDGGTTPEELFSRYNLDINRSLPEQLKGKNIDEFDPILNRLRSGKIPSEREAYGQSLIDFLKGKGGVNTKGPGSQVQAMEINGLTKKNGMELDRAAEQAHESGYLKEPDTHELLGKLDSESRGEKQYSEQNRHPVKADEREMLMEMDRYLRNNGVDISSSDNETIKKALDENQKSPKTISDFFQGNVTDLKTRQAKVFSENNLPEGFHTVHDTIDKSWYYVEKDGEEGNPYSSGTSPEEAIKEFYSSEKNKDKPWYKELVDQRKIQDPNALYQGGNEPRGGITFAPDKTTISLLKDANLSTFIHETGHFFTKVLGDLAMAPGASERTIEIYRALWEFVGAEPGAELNREQHEKAAKAFEKYAMEGKAPSSSLRGAFAAFRAWLIYAYKSLVAHPDIQLTSEVRNAFDRMIATDDEISDARNSVGLDPLFSDPHKLMNAQDAEKYAKVVAEAKAAGEDDLTRKVMKQVERERSKQYAIERDSVEKEVTSEVNERPEYKTLDAIKTGELPNGEKANLKLDRKSLVRDFGKEIVSEMPRVIFTPDGLHYEQLADLMGMQSGHELVMMLANTLPKEELIQQETDKEMKARYAYEDPTVNGQMQEEAMKSIHNAKESARLAFELKWIMDNKLGAYKNLMRKIGQRVLTAAEFKKQADVVTATISTRDLKPYIYQRAEVKAAREAMDHALKGAWDKAFQAKYQEFLNHELYKAVSEAQDDVKKSIDDFKEFHKKDDVLSKTRDMNMINAGRMILDDIEVGSVKKGKTADDYLAKLKAYGDDDQYRETTAQIESLGDLKAYGDMPYGQFQAVRDQINALWDLAKMNKEIQTAEGKVDLDEARDAIRGQLENLNKTDIKYQGEGISKSSIEKVKTVGMNLAAGLVRIEHFVDAVSNGDINSPLYKYFWLPIKEAAAKFHLADEETQEKISKINDAVLDNLDRKRIEAPELGQSPDGQDIYFKDSAALMMAIAHAGNESNLKKLLVGRGWGSIDPDTGVLDRNRWDEFLNRAMESGHVSEEMMDWVQNMWDLNKSLLPDAQRAHKNRYGTYFDEIKHTPIKTPFGDYEGGYIPAAADRDSKHIGYTDQVLRQGKAVIDPDSGYSLLPPTSNGWTKKRSENYNVPLSLDARLIGSHVREVLKFSHLDPTIYQTGKLVLDRGVSKAFDGMMDGFTKNALIPFLDRAKNQTSSKVGDFRALDQVVNYIRTNSTAAIMFANVKNTVIQLHGLPMALTKVRGDYLARGLLSYLQSPKTTSSDIAEKSDWMRGRFNDRASTMRTTLKDISVGSGVASDFKSYIKANTYFAQHVVAQTVDIGVWHGAYNESIAKGFTEDQAVNKADAAVSQTQHNFEPQSMSAIEHQSPLFKAMLGMYSYQNMKLNLQGSEYYKALKFNGITRSAFKAAPVFLFTSMIPAAMITAIGGSLAGKPWDESGDGAWQSFISQMSENLGHDSLSEIPFAGSIINSVLYEKGKGKSPNDALRSPTVDALYSAAHAVPEIKDGLKGEKFDNKSIKDSLTLISLIAGVPVAPLARPISYLNDVSSGKAHPGGPIDFTRGLLTGQKGK